MSFGRDFTRAMESEIESDPVELGTIFDMSRDPDEDG